MKTRWWLADYATLLLALTCGVAVGQGRGNQNRQQQGQQQAQFNAHDNQVAHDWYNKHQTKPPAGVRDQDRLPPDKESRLQRGKTLDPDMERMSHRVPSDLKRDIAPAPRGSHDVLLGHHVVRVDKTNVIQDLLHLEINVGR
jgi:hypothetical protein